MTDPMSVPDSKEGWTSASVKWLFSQPFNNVLTAAYVAGFFWIIFWVFTVGLPTLSTQIIPQHLRSIQDGYEKVVKENNMQLEKLSVQANEQLEKMNKRNNDQHEKQIQMYDKWMNILTKSNGVSVRLRPEVEKAVPSAKVKE